MDDWCVKELDEQDVFWGGRGRQWESFCLLLRLTEGGEKLFWSRWMTAFCHKGAPQRELNFSILVLYFTVILLGHGLAPPVDQGKLLSPSVAPRLSCGDETCSVKSFSNLTPCVLSVSNSAEQWQLLRKFWALLGTAPLDETSSAQSTESSCR